MILGLLLATTTWGQKAEEYRVKAAFLFNFAKFVEWPPQIFTDRHGPHCASAWWGKILFGDALDEAVNGKTVDGRTFLVRQVSGEQPAARLPDSVRQFVGTEAVAHRSSAKSRPTAY